ncbi:MAG: hypothetical protein DMG58_23585 [Acidobacteria bacterium]|nr:MAG: hypothetical protein DMG58_23585 [Acidobacteriota bacterium]
MALDDTCDQITAFFLLLVLCFAFSICFLLFRTAGVFPGTTTSWFRNNGQRVRHWRVYWWSGISRSRNFRLRWRRFS